MQSFVFWHKSAAYEPLCGWTVSTSWCPAIDACVHDGVGVSVSKPPSLTKELVTRGLVDGEEARDETFGRALSRGFPPREKNPLVFGVTLPGAFFPPPACGEDEVFFPSPAWGGGLGWG